MSWVNSWPPLKFKHDEPNPSTCITCRWYSIPWQESPVDASIMGTILMNGKSLQSDYMCMYQVFSTKDGVVSTAISVPHRGWRQENTFLRNNFHHFYLLVPVSLFSITSGSTWQSYVQRSNFQKTRPNNAKFKSDACGNAKHNFLCMA